MNKFDVFISHSSFNKELARLTYYTAINNDLKPWYDEAIFQAGDELLTSLHAGINASSSFVLFASKEALESPYVQQEMTWAKVRKKEDPEFRLLVIPLGAESILDSWWGQFLRVTWQQDDEAGSILSLLEALTGKSVTAWITGAAFLSGDPSTLYANDSASLAEHSRNWILLYVSQLKNLLTSIVCTPNYSEDRDTLEKLLSSSLLRHLPNISGPFVMLEPGIFEVIHANRMRIPPRVVIAGLPDHLRSDVLESNELFTTVRIAERVSGQTYTRPFPFALTVSLSAEL